MNQELRDLFVADQSERRGDIAYDTTSVYNFIEDRNALTFCRSRPTLVA